MWENITTSKLWPIHTLHNQGQYHAFGSWMYHVWIIARLWICHGCIMHWSWKITDRSWKGKGTLLNTKIHGNCVPRKLIRFPNTSSLNEYNCIWFLIWKVNICKDVTWLLRNNYSQKNYGTTCLLKVDLILSLQIHKQLGFNSVLLRAQ